MTLTLEEKKELNRQRVAAYRAAHPEYREEEKRKKREKYLKKISFKKTSIGTAGYGWVNLQPEITSLFLPTWNHVMPPTVYEHKEYPVCSKCSHKFVPIGDYKSCFACRFTRK